MRTMGPSWAKTEWTNLPASAVTSQIRMLLSAPPAAADVALKEFAAVQRARNRWLAVVAVLLAGVIALLLMRPL